MDFLDLKAQQVIIQDNNSLQFHGIPFS